jgi:hypothetical protein
MEGPAVKEWRPWRRWPRAWALVDVAAGLSNLAAWWAMGEGMTSAVPRWIVGCFGVFCVAEGLGNLYAMRRRALIRRMLAAEERAAAPNLDDVRATKVRGTWRG